MPEIGVSSTRIRRAGRRAAADPLPGPGPVAELIAERGLYRRRWRRERGRARARAGRGRQPAAAIPAAELARRIAAIADDKQGEEIVALDVGDLVGYTDYLVIATARNERQAKAIHDEVHARLKRERGLLPARVEGEGEARWVLPTTSTASCTCWCREMRERYRLERLWGEAERLELGLDGEPAG